MRQTFRKFSCCIVAVIAVASLSSCAELVRQARAHVPMSSAEHAMVDDINHYRNDHGLGSLSANTWLAGKAHLWATFMANGGCGRVGANLPAICHSSLAAGITVAWTRLEENVGMVSGRANLGGMESAFEHSPEHAANMLNGQIHYIGVGVAYTGNYMYVAEEFMAT